MSSGRTLRILTYNIHKGFSAWTRKNVLTKMKQTIEGTHADLVCLQEVRGKPAPQFEQIAGKIWPHHRYGKNAVYTDSHHGNAILCKHPITFFENEDVSSSRIERRGLLHVEIALPHSKVNLHAFSVHLGLFQRDRTQQMRALALRIAKKVPPEAPLIIAGDFNDWREKASPLLKSSLGVEEAFLTHNGVHALTFPSALPFLALDRIYYRNLKCRAVAGLRGKTWSELSDHLPLLAEFEL